MNHILVLCKNYFYIYGQLTQHNINSKLFESCL